MRAGVGHCTGPTQRASGMGAASTETLGAMMDLSRLERQDARVRLEAGYLNQLFEQEFLTDVCSTNLRKHNKHKHIDK